MIKGVNKKIIEISNTGNGTFEKAILIVNPESGGIGMNEINRRANNYISSFGLKSGSDKKPGALLVLLISVASMMLGVIAGILMNVYFG
ncbi:MAG: hypothetical protein FWG69_01520 [Oscillospiraceae bacterium]|nr:hypothetical protein [Oscillospiraceae bacterium]